ncbi:hypothetical protein CEXT_705661 [Caerostris extrusa]|uniref:Uncharacterized protein n=1 Tax=Caerostris extrusa TaxID=172846 RepID=A0AAV4MPH9_CAEEX|nr:hypothetical protein CEXT_705661 [Caerostris extrusa]
MEDIPLQEFFHPPPPSLRGCLRHTISLAIPFPGPFRPPSHILSSSIPQGLIQRREWGITSPLANALSAFCKYQILQECLLRSFLSFLFFPLPFCSFHFLQPPTATTFLYFPFISFSKLRFVGTPPNETFSTPRPNDLLGTCS